MSQANQKLKTVVRLNLPNSYHELTFSCYKNFQLLTTDRACSNLANAINKACEKHGFKVIAYVFMPTHAHLLVKPFNHAHNISDFLKSIKQSSSRNELKYIRENQPELAFKLLTGQQYGKYRFWQDGGGYDRNIFDKRTLKYSIDYIHNNPVRKGYVLKPVDWKWSSAGDWYNNLNGFIPIEKRLM